MGCRVRRLRRQVRHQLDGQLRRRSRLNETERLAAGVLRRRGRILLCHRRDDRASYPGVWDLPGGHVREGEDPSEAVVRELQEELGVQVDAPVNGAELVLSDPGIRLEVFIFDEWRGVIRNAAPEEHDAIGWYSATELRSLDLADPSYVETLTALLD